MSYCIVNHHKHYDPIGRIESSGVLSLSLTIGMTHNSGEYLHALIEALQLSFADTRWYCSDPALTTVPTRGLLDKAYAAQRRSLMDPKKYIYTVSLNSPHFCEASMYVAPCIMVTWTIILCSLFSPLKFHCSYNTRI